MLSLGFGKLLLEVGNLCAWYPKELLPEAFRLAAAKLSVTTTFVTRTVR